MVAVIVALVAVPLGSTISTGIANAQTHTPVLLSDSVLQYAYGDNATGYHDLAFSAATNLTPATITNTYTVNVKNATGVEVPTTYQYTPVILRTNVTVADFNNYAVNKFTVALGTMDRNLTAYLGTGSSASNFQQLEDLVVKANATHENATFAVSPALLTGNQSAYMMVELSFANDTYAPASISVSFTTYGVSNGVSTYLAGEDGGYIISGTLLFMFGFLAMPWHDISLKKSKSAFGPVRVGKPRKQSKPKQKKTTRKR